MSNLLNVELRKSVNNIRGKVLLLFFVFCLQGSINSAFAYFIFYIEPERVTDGAYFFERLKSVLHQGGTQDASNLPRGEGVVFFEPNAISSINYLLQGYRARLPNRNLTAVGFSLGYLGTLSKSDSWYGWSEAMAAVNLGPIVLPVTGPNLTYDINIKYYRKYGIQYALVSDLMLFAKVLSRTALSLRLENMGSRLGGLEGKDPMPFRIGGNCLFLIADSIGKVNAQLLVGYGIRRQFIFEDPDYNADAPPFFVEMIDGLSKKTFRQNIKELRHTCDAEVALFNRLYLHANLAIIPKSLFDYSKLLSFSVMFKTTDMLDFEIGKGFEFVPEKFSGATPPYFWLGTRLRL